MNSFAAWPQASQALTRSVSSLTEVADAAASSDASRPSDGKIDMQALALAVLALMKHELRVEKERLGERRFGKSGTFGD
jgi:hypothetical protein